MLGVDALPAAPVGGAHDAEEREQLEEHEHNVHHEQNDDDHLQARRVEVVLLVAQHVKHLLEHLQRQGREAARKGSRRQSVSRGEAQLNLM